MYYIKINDEGYITDWCDMPQEGDFLEVPSPNDAFDFLDNWANYRLVDGQLQRDEDAVEAEARRKEIEAQIADLRQQLNNTNDVVMEGLESLFSATTIAGFISALAENAKNLKQTLQDRTAIREQIAELSK